ncbi:GNAT family N-acetyltransferase [Thalassoroseus pseudoceratinae]|uniref:GNAT family N-acetyltransferase n=1 Tax=Thalassoroseus pseudoceratinae TaxID=2713176 RepID=UPI001421BB6A|nr:GNAT family N-acetyltransferase [Thalassoroseus pseudoceratinae]
MWKLRPYQAGDASELLSLFRDTIQRINCRDYTPEQIEAWASDDIDDIAWADRFTGRFVIVAEQNERPIGFGELEPNGHIDRFYVSADHQGIGIGRGLITTIFEEATRQSLPRLTVEASITARPFFERHGFATLERQIVVCRGVEMVNYRMARELPV